MKVCICNNFNDKAVQQYLDERRDEKIKLSDLYKICSEGRKPQCGICVREYLKDIVQAHNDNLPSPK